MGQGAGVTELFIMALLFVPFAAVVAGVVYVLGRIFGRGQRDAARGSHRHRR